MIYSLPSHPRFIWLIVISQIDKQYRPRHLANHNTLAQLTNQSPSCSSEGGAS